jgi:hypothetical protein
MDAVVEFHHRIVGPKLLLDFLTRDQPTRTLHQHQPDLERLFLEKYFPVSAVQFARLGIKLEGPDPHSIWELGFH